MTRRNRLTAALMASAAVIAMNLQAPAAQAETLADALVAAMETNPQLDQSRARLKVLDENAAIARAGGRPSVTGQVVLGADYTDTSEPIRGDSETDLSASARAEVRQRLYDGGRTSNSVKSAEAVISAGRFDLIDAEQRVLLEAVTAYVEVRRAEENVSLARNNVSVIGEQLAAARDRFDVGEVTRTDVAQADARLAEARANLERRIGLLGQAKASYRRAIGSAPNDLAPTPPLPELPSSIEEAEAIALDNHPQVEAARDGVTAAGLDVRTAIGATLPSVDLVGDVSAQAVGENNSSDQFNVGASVEATIPFYRGGELRSRVRQEQALASQRRAELQDVTRQVLEQVRASWENLAAAKATIKANRQQINAARIAFDGVQEEAKVGSRTTLDVLDAEQELLDARVALNNAERDEYLAGYQLLSSIGLLTAAHLGLDVPAYDPTASYQESQSAFPSYDDTEDAQWGGVLEP